MRILNKKIISILGCGWLGLPLAKELINTGSYIVKGSTTTSDKLEKIENVGAQPFKVDLGQRVPGEFLHCDVLVVTIPPSSENYEENIFTLIDHIQSSGIRKVLFVSTTSVYPDLNTIVNESDAAYITSSHSGVTMLAIEDYFRDNDNFETTVLRFAGLYGPDRSPGRFLAGRKGLRGADNPVNLIHLEDCIDIVICIIESGCWGETFNACADEHPTRKEFYTTAAVKLGKEPPTFTKEPSGYKIINSEKLKKRLGYKFLHQDPMKDLVG